MSSGIDQGCSIVSRYMSRTWSVPSGALTKLTGRNQVSVEATNSASGVGAAGAEGDAVGLDGLAVDQVVGDLAEEELAAVRRRVGVAAIDGHAAGGGQVSRADQLAPRHHLADGRPAPGAELAPGLGRADPEHRDRVARLGRVVQGPGSGEVRIPRQVAGGQDDVLGRVADVAKEAVAPVVERVAEPAPPEIASNARVSGRNRKSRRRTEMPRPPGSPDAADLAPVARPCAVDRVVQAPLEVVHHGLDVVLAEPREDLLADLGPAVAVGVAEVPDARRRGDEHAPLPDRDAGRPGELVGQDRRGVERPSPSRSVRSLSRPIGGSSRVLGERLVVLRVDVRVVGHLHDVEPSVLVVRRRDRVVTSGSAAISSMRKPCRVRNVAAAAPGSVGGVRGNRGWPTSAERAVAATSRTAPRPAVPPGRMRKMVS